MSAEYLRMTGPVDESTAADLYQVVVDVVAGGGAIGWPEPPSRPAFDRWLNDVIGAVMAAQAAAMLCLDPRAGVLGFGYWRRYPRPTLRHNADMEKVFVAPAARGGGIGRRLIEDLLTSARAAGVETITLDARGDNVGAIRLYESFGFAEYGRLLNFVAFGPHRYDQILLSLLLNPALSSP